MNKEFSISTYYSYNNTNRGINKDDINIHRHPDQHKKITEDVQNTGPWPP